jgi:hypothetical protein
VKSEKRKAKSEKRKAKSEKRKAKSEKLGRFGYLSKFLSIKKWEAVEKQLVYPLFAIRF